MRYGPCDDIEGLYTGVALTSGYANLNYSVSVNNGNVEDVNGFFSGWTLGAGYTNGGYSQTSSQNSIDVTTTGTVNYSLFWNGFGTLYSQPVRYGISIPCGEGGGGKPRIYPLPFSSK